MLKVCRACLRSTPRWTLVVWMGLAAGLTGCAGMHTLSARNRQLETTVAQLRVERKQFEDAYYETRATLDAELAQARADNDRLRLELDQARNLKTQREKELEDDLRSVRVEYQALQDRTDEDRVLAESQAARLENERAAVILERNAAQAQQADLQAQLEATGARANETAAQLAKHETALQARDARIAELEKQTAALEKQLAEKQQAEENAQAQARRVKQLEDELAALKGTHAKELEQTRRASDPTRNDALIALTAQLRGRIETAGATDARVRLDAKGVRVILPVAALFDEGAVTLSQSGKALLDALATDLAEADGPIRPIHIEGHTDDQPLGDLPFADHWGLGYAWADRVRGRLMEGRLAAGRLTALSRGAVEPLAGNDTPEGRAQNRRVEIVIGLPVP